MAPSDPAQPAPHRPVRRSRYRPPFPVWCQYGILYRDHYVLITSRHQTVQRNRSAAEESRDRPGRRDLGRRSLWVKNAPHGVYAERVDLRPQRTSDSAGRLERARIRPRIGPVDPPKSRSRYVVGFVRLLCPYGIRLSDDQQRRLAVKGKAVKTAALMCSARGEIRLPRGDQSPNSRATNLPSERLGTWCRPDSSRQ